MAGYPGRPTTKVDWGPSRELSAQESFYDTMRKQPSEDSLLVDSKDVEDQLSRATTVMRATYAYPYQMHGSVGTSCAVADVKSGRATIWSATQSVYPTRSIVSKILALPLDNVRVIYVRGSGCYGLNGADTVSLDAALAVARGGTPGSSPAFPPGRDGLGELRSRVRDRSTRRH